MARKRKWNGDETAALDDCVVPPAIPKNELHKLLFRQSEQESAAIHDYVEWQAPDEKVLHAEKVASERIHADGHIGAE
jgi:hypothetical protein